MQTKAPTKRHKFVDLMKENKITICCLQETLYKHNIKNKSKEQKQIYYGNIN